MFHGNRNEAVIMFFEPTRRFDDHYKRPYQFDIRDEHKELIYDYLEDDRDRLTAKNLLKDNRMQDMVLPSTEGFNVQTSQLNDRWMFMAMVPTGDQDPLGFTRTMSKKFLMGYCTQEPLTNRAIFSATIGLLDINPSCDLVVTKTIDTSDTSTSGASGGRRTIQCAGDFATVSGNVQGLDLFSDLNRNQFTQKNDIYGMDSIAFGRSLQDVNIVSGGGIYDGAIFSDDSESLHRKQSITVPVAEHSPHLRAQKFLTSLKSAKREASINNDVDPYADERTILDDPFTIENDIRASMAIESNNQHRAQDEKLSRILADMGSQANRTSFGINHSVDTIINAAVFVRSTQASIKIEQAQYAPNSVGVETIEQSYIGKTNFYSSIIAAFVPSIMATLSIDLIEFRYDTYNDTNGMDAHFHDAGKRGAREYDMYVPCGPFGLMYEATRDEVAAAYRRFIDLFRMEIVPILKEAARSGSRSPGEFSVYVHSSLSGDTHVKLFFKDGDAYYKTGEDVVYRDHTVLGGIVSPLLGTRSDLTRNINAVKHTLEYTAGTIVDRGGNQIFSQRDDIEDLYMPQNELNFNYSRDNGGYSQRDYSSNEPSNDGSYFKEKLNWA